MPVLGLSSSRGAGQSPGAKLSGWAGIEDYLLKHDSGMVKDLADDIDTLLVFAGLFSAVLTAFVVETYSLLQPDGSTTTNQLLAYGFASQFATQHLPSTFNETIASLTSSSDFTPASSARWINALFFLSLVFSLAAAFFGILAKQWLREYIRWNAPTGSPQDNIIVRQIRFEAWEAWNVAATITSIPVLLELAMVLFLIGVVILLWMLDNIVAIIVTVAVGCFIFFAALSTIMPVIAKQCPYRSPTAWICAMACELIRSLWGHIVDSLERIFTHACTLVGWRSTAAKASRRTSRSTGRLSPNANLQPRRISGESGLWRAQDILSVHRSSLYKKNRTSGWRAKKEWLGGAAQQELDRQRCKLDGQVESNKPYSGSATDDEGKALLYYIDETAFLLRALSWIRDTSPNGEILADIAESLASHKLRYAWGDITTADEIGFCYVANRSLLCAELRTSMKDPHLMFSSEDISYMRDSQFPIINMSACADVSSLLVLHLMNNQLKDSIESLPTIDAARDSSSMPTKHVSVIQELLAVNTSLVQPGHAGISTRFESADFRENAPFQIALRNILSADGVTKHILETRIPGARLSALRILLTIGSEEIVLSLGRGQILAGTHSSEGIEHEIRGPFSRLAKMPLHMWSDEDLALFLHWIEHSGSLSRISRNNGWSKHQSSAMCAELKVLTDVMEEYAGRCNSFEGVMEVRRWLPDATSPTVILSDIIVLTAYMRMMIQRLWHVFEKLFFAGKLGSGQEAQLRRMLKESHSSHVYCDYTSDCVWGQRTHADTQVVSSYEPVTQHYTGSARSREAAVDGIAPGTLAASVDTTDDRSMDDQPEPREYHNDGRDNTSTTHGSELRSRQRVDTDAPSLHEDSADNLGGASAGIVDRPVIPVRVEVEPQNIPLPAGSDSSLHSPTTEALSLAEMGEHPLTSADQPAAGSTGSLGGYAQGRVAHTGSTSSPPVSDAEDTEPDIVEVSREPGERPTIVE